MNRRARRSNFQFDMLSLLLLLLLVLPFYHPYLLLSSKMRPGRASIGGVIALATYLVAFWRLGKMLPGVPAPNGALFTVIQARPTCQLPAAGLHFLSLQSLCSDRCADQGRLCSTCSPTVHSPAHTPGSEPSPLEHSHSILNQTHPEGLLFRVSLSTSRSAPAPPPHRRR